MRSNPIHIHEPDLNVGAGTINGGAVLNGILTAACLTANNLNSAGGSATLADPTVPGLQITKRIGRTDGSNEAR